MRDAVTVLALHIGKARERWPGRPPSAIGKQAVQRPLALLREGFAEDEQADRQVHGGPEKAVHHYPCDHYAHWRETFPDHASVFAIGGFGENIATEGITEETVCLGDRFSRAGSSRPTPASRRWRHGCRSRDARAGTTGCWKKAWLRPATC
jgi:MOSC domain-containing protein YiiM